MENMVFLLGGCVVVICFNALAVEAYVRFLTAIARMQNPVWFAMTKLLGAITTTAILLWSMVPVVTLAHDRTDLPSETYLSVIIAVWIFSLLYLWFALRRVVTPTEENGSNN